MQRKHVEFLREADGVFDGFLGLDGQAEDERAVNHHAGLVAGFGEAAHFVHRHAFLDAGQDVVVAAFVADEEQAQAIVFERFDRVVIEVRAAVTAPVDAERAKLLRDLTGAREVRGEGVVIEEKLAHLREEFLHVGHFVGDVLRAADAVFVSADGLRPEAEGALRRTTASRGHADVGVQEVADEIFSIRRSRL